MGEGQLDFRRVRRGGEYLRVADPAWTNRLDPSYSQRSGGRWNPPGSFPVLYLNADIEIARARVDRNFAGLPYGPLDLRPDRRPVLVGTVVPAERFVDIVTERGCQAAGLPATYPRHRNGREVSHARCQPVGVAAREQDLPGIACRSAARPGGEELAWFIDQPPAPTGSRAFDAWYWER